MKVNSFRDLIVWQKSFLLAKEIYNSTSQFPKHEQYGLTSQIRRCAVSIPSNIAEGYTRRYRREYSQFLKIAAGSGAELETQLLLARDIKYLHEDDYQKISNLLTEVMKMLSTIIRTLDNRNGVNPNS